MLVERDHVGIFGKMNSGKSSIMNLLTQQQTSLVDPTPGTTAATKIALQEIHGMGPVKLFDTAGLRRKAKITETAEKLSASDAIRAIRFAEVVVLLIDAERPFEHQDRGGGCKSGAGIAEKLRKRPQPSVAPRLEAIAAGQQRRVGQYDTGTRDINAQL